MLLKLTLHRRMKDIRVGMKASTSSPLSAEHWGSTMSQQRMNYPSILQTLDNHQPHQSIMKSTHLEGTYVTVLYTTDWCSPVQMMRVLWEQNLVHQVPQPVSLPHTHTKHRAVVHRCQWCCTGWWHKLLQGKLPNCTIGWWSLVQRSNSRWTAVHPWDTSQSKPPVFLPTYSTTTFRIDLPQSTPQDTAVFFYEQMDFSDILLNSPDIMMTTSENDIHDLEDILNSEHLDNIQHKAWFA